jgi:hypothetical protein
VTHHTLDSEDALEQATLALFRQMGWDTVNCMDELFGDGTDVAMSGTDVALQRLHNSTRPNLGRETTGEILFQA